MVLLLQLPVYRSPHGGNCIHALCSYVSALDYLTEPAVNYLDTDANDVAFVQATGIIRDSDAVEEFLGLRSLPALR
jgi:hypothetical protein